MKKIISVAMALVMFMAICVPAFAADLTKNNQSGDITVITATLKDTDGDGVGDTDAEDYTITIPADTTIPWGTESTDVSYSVEAHLKRGNRVKVTVSGTGAMTTEDGVYSLAYTLAGAGVSYVADIPTIYPAAEQTVTVDISADSWNGAVVEAYKGPITYTAEIVAA